MSDTDNAGWTGNPPGMLQDDSAGMSKWLASKPDAMRNAREAAAAIAARAPECVIVCQQSVDCGAWPDGACEQGCAQAERAAQAGDEMTEEQVRKLSKSSGDIFGACWPALFWQHATLLVNAALAARGAQAEPKDHEIAVTVNTLRDIAREFHDHESLRERIAQVAVPMMKAARRLV
jgi:hypothetical protein